MSEEIVIEKQVYNATEIMEILPHRFPFLLVDRITEVTEKGGKGFKNATINEAFFQGHFPGFPIYPGVLIIEGMAQCAGFVAMKVLDAKAGAIEKKNRLVFFATIDNVKFRKPVSPGDRLDYEVEIVTLSSRGAKFRGVTKLNGEIACEADMMAVISNQK